VGDASDQDPVETLRRWERSGAVWRVLGRSRDAVTIGLFSCDGGEQMGRIVSADPRVRGYVDARPDSETPDSSL
jgi:hypothetical protein